MRLYLELSAVTRLLDSSKSYRAKKHLQGKKSIKSLLEAKEKKIQFLKSLSLHNSCPYDQFYSSLLNSFTCVINNQGICQ